MGRFVVLACVVAATVMAACFITPDRPGNGPSDAPAGDAPATDGNHDGPADAACGSFTVTCNGDSLQESCDGAVTNVPCGWGCVSTGTAHCGAITPTAGIAVAADFELPGLGSATISGTLDGDTGAIGSLRGAGSGVVAGIGYRLDPASGAAVFSFASVTVAGPLVLTGSHAIVLVASGAVEIDGTIDATGSCSGTAPGPGGFAGGAAQQPGAGACGGNEATGNGGGGGGHGGIGGAGTRKNGNSATPGGPSQYSDANLVGGCGGGGGGASSAGTGGGGGGALQVVSNTSIAIAAGGAINAGGCGGAANLSIGGGGGAGGTVMLEAPVVTVNGAVAVNGGGGAAGANNTGSGAGANGRSDRTPAPGGLGPMNFTTQDGGSGAAGPVSDGFANAGAISNQGGGGGGAVGFLRFTTRTGSVPGSGTLSPSLADGTTAHAYTAAVH